MHEAAEAIGNTIGYVFPNDLHVHWSLMIVLYPYITGLVAGAFIVSSLYHVFKLEAFKPLARFSLLFAFAFMLCATLPLMVHLGHPERAVSMLLTPNPTSAMAGFGYIYGAYAFVLFMEILFIYRPTMSRFYQSATGPMKHVFFFLSTGSDNLSEKARNLDKRIIGILAGIGIPMACVLHGYVGFIFGGIKANPLWATPLMPVIFLLSAAVSGIAGIIVAYYILMRIKGREVDQVCVRSATKFLWGFFIVDFTFEMLEIFSHGYMATHHWHSLHNLLWGPLYQSYWVYQVGVFSVIPVLILGYLSLVNVKDKIFNILAPLASVMILIQVLLMRWNVVIGGQMMSKSERGTLIFQPGWLEKEGILPAIILMCLPVLVLFALGKIFPFWLEDDGKDRTAETAES
ncbi:MAG: polysulfide reductase NrfD [bacterium]|nr:polysulfide reductase NrfD [bacterium]